MAKIDAHKYNQLIFEKGPKQFNEEWRVFLTNGAEKLDNHMQKKNLITCLIP